MWGRVLGWCEWKIAVGVALGTGVMGVWVGWGLNWGDGVRKGSVATGFS